MQEEKTEIFDEEDPAVTPVDDALIDTDWNNDAGDTDVGKSETLPADNNPGQSEPKADQSYKLKYLGQEIDVSKDELIKLAQKGRDYDRIRGRADTLSDELKKTGGYKSFLESLAKKSGQTLEGFMNGTNSVLTSGGVFDSSADTTGSSGAVQDPLSQTDKPSKGTGNGGPEQLGCERRSREVSEFLSEYGMIDPKTIPVEVWDGVRGGKTLLGAYQSFENKRLKAQIEAEKKNLENRRKAAGSRQSPGGARARGEIEDDWYKD